MLTIRIWCGRLSRPNSPAIHDRHGVSVIETASNTVVATVPVDERGTHSVAITPDEAFAYVTAFRLFKLTCPQKRYHLVLCSQSLFRFADLGDDGLCRGGPDKGCGVIVSAIDVVVDRLD